MNSPLRSLDFFNKFLHLAFFKRNIYHYKFSISFFLSFTILNQYKVIHTNGHLINLLIIKYPLDLEEKNLSLLKIVFRI